MKFLWVGGLVVLCCAGAPAQEKVTDLDGVLEKLQDTWDDLRSFVAVYTAEMPAPANEGTDLTAQAKGDLKVLKHRGVMKYRLDQKVSLVDGAGHAEMTSRTVTLYDGEHTYVMNDTGGSKTVVVLSEANEQSRIPMDAKSLLENLRQLGEVKLLPEETINGAETYVFEGAPLLPNGSPETTEASKMRAYVHKDTGVPIRWELLDSAGHGVAEGGYTDIAVNVKLDPKEFVFEVPVGATVIDMTSPDAQAVTPNE